MHRTMLVGLLQSGRIGVSIGSTDESSRSHTAFLLFMKVRCYIFEVIS
jgi:hypothetical protein